MDLLENLNPQQRQAVTAPEGEVLVLAGPGSGKTRVLTRRIAYLIREMGVPPHRLLAVTFTNRAAREMGERVQQLVEGSLEGIWLGTFHAMCARILRRESALLPFKSNFVIFDDDDQITLVKRALRELNLDEKINRPSSILAGISAAKNNLVAANDFTAKTFREEVVAKVYRKYQELLRANNAVDFDDLLLEAVFLLRDNPDVRDGYSNRFEHVLVDEFQDTNLAQYELLKHLSSRHHNLFVVGDEDQSIYRWRGADYRNVLNFETDFKKSQKILLEQNYRSTQNVLDAARAVIDQNRNRTPKALFTERGSGECITLYEATDDHAEAAFVVDLIQSQAAAHKAKLSDFAVMYRTNAQSRLLEEAFLRAGIPYRLVGAQRFYGRREVKDLIAFLRLVANPADELSLNRVINVPQRGIGDKTLLTLQMAAHKASKSPADVLLSLGEVGDASPFWAEFKGRGAYLLADFGAMLGGWLKAAPGLSVPALFDTIVADSGYEGFINDGSEEGADRWENVLELRRLAYEFLERDLSSFLENLALVSDQDTLTDDAGAEVKQKKEVPTLLTLHAAKGLEFKHVIITGLDEGLLPHSRSRDDPEEMAEERRLFYVGLTRAMNHITLVRSEQRSTFGSFEYSIASRFLDDIPDDLLLRQGMHAHSGRARRERQQSMWTLPPKPGGSAAITPQVIKEPRYKAGMRVKHSAWGEGLVVDVRLQDGDERIDVFFDDVGFKRLLGSVAALEIIR